MSNTPRTDEAEFVIQGDHVVYADFARQLEQELTEATRMHFASHQYAEELRQANTKLVCAIDLIRETLAGGEVQDLHNIINAALLEYKRAQKPSGDVLELRAAARTVLKAEVQ